MRILWFFCIFCCSIVAMEKNQKEQQYLKERLTKIIELVHQEPDPRPTHFSEIMEIVLTLVDIVDHPEEYIKKHSGTEASLMLYSRRECSVWRAVRLFFEQPLIMYYGNTVDDSLLVRCGSLDESQLDHNRQFFRKAFMQTLYRRLLAP